MLMHSLARRAAGGLWRRSSSHGIAKRCTLSTSSANGSVNKDACAKSTQADLGSSCDNFLADTITSDCGLDEISNPPAHWLHKAILAGEVTLPPSRRVWECERAVTTFTMATGGMWRLPIPGNMVASDEDCTDCLQYHKITIQDVRLGKLATRTLRRGMQVYVEGELETTIFNDVKGAVKREREIVVYDTGKIVAWTEKGPISLDELKSMTS